MPAAQALKDYVQWLFETFPSEFRRVLIFLQDEIQHLWAKLFASKNILIFGARETGKTALLYFMKHGHPYKIVNGEIRAPNPTSFAAVIQNEKIALEKRNWVKLKTDVSGDPQAQETWAQAIATIQPHGIIYMINGTQEPAKLEAAVAEIFDRVLSHYQNGLRELATLHLFVNFSDKWKITPLVEQQMLDNIKQHFVARWSEREPLHHLRYDFSATQLSPHRNVWPEVARALKRFAADLDDSGKL